MSEEKHCSNCRPGGGTTPSDTGCAGSREQNEPAVRLDGIDRKIMVLSGKGGVGKSTVSVNLALSLAMAGKTVGLLDVDIHGPSVPKLLGLEEVPITGDEDWIYPVEYSRMLKVMSIGFLLGNPGDPVIWRGPLKYNLIKQFLCEVSWGNLDYLIIDSPPGTGDEPLTIAQLIGDMHGALIVTTPQELAIEDVKKSINFCRSLSMPILGVVENMSGFLCPHCGRWADIFKSGGGETMAREMGVPFLGGIPLDSGIVEACDQGKPFVYHDPESRTAKFFDPVVRKILDMDNDPKVPEETNLKKRRA